MRTTRGLFDMYMTFIFSVCMSDFKATLLYTFEGDSSKHMLEFPPSPPKKKFQWANRCLLAADWGAVMRVRLILISLTMRERVKQKYPMRFCQSCVIIKAKQFVRFIRYRKIHQFFNSFIALDSDFRGKTWNSSRSTISLQFRHGSLRLLAFSEIGGTI